MLNVRDLDIKIERRLEELWKRSIVRTMPIEDWTLSAGTAPERARGAEADAKKAGPEQQGPLRPLDRYWDPRVYSAPPSVLYFTTRLRIPRANEGETVFLALDFQHEGLVLWDGAALQGIDRNHVEVAVLEADAGEHDVRVEVDLYTGWADRNNPFEIKVSEWRLVSPVARAAYYDMWTVLHGSRLNSLRTEERVAVLRVLDAACNRVQWNAHDREAFIESVASVQGNFMDDVRALGIPARGEVFAIGHSHIDVAWLWTLEQTRRKAQRTYATVMHLMRQYPHYQFAQSTPQLYAFLQEERPELFERVKAEVKNGRFQPVGPMWVESDCNLTSGESLVRQIVYGRRWLRKELGVDSHVAWLPDVFGFSYSLPQILKLGGLNYFYTIKLSWNDTNQFPYDLFWWEGIDGTRVLAHMLSSPGSGYNGSMKVGEAYQFWDSYKAKPDHGEILYPFGFGDGGGGPTAEMLEVQFRLLHVPGAPQVRTGNVEEFFTTLPADVKLPVWNGDLYLELHRGTYTSQGRVKWLHRRAEGALHSAEALMVATGNETIARRLYDSWITLLRNEFHDILPGSGVRGVYEDAERELQSVIDAAEHVSLEALQALHEVPGAAAMESKRSWCVWQPSPLARRDLLQLKGVHFSRGAKVVSIAGETLTTQDAAEGALVQLGDRNPYTLSTIYEIVNGALADADEHAQGNGVQVSLTSLENAFLRAEWSARGVLRRIYDKEVQREILTDASNRLMVYLDKPHDWDAWEIDADYGSVARQLLPARVSVLEQGPLRAALEFVYEYGASRITQTVRLESDSRLLEFATDIEWREHSTMLRADFTVGVHARFATYDIAFGNAERPTHCNTSWEQAAFEVPAHKWADLSEDDYGVSLVNNGRYGHSVRGSRMGLSLLKSAVWPDPEADQGAHHVEYGLYCHKGDWRRGNTMAVAYALNHPYLVARLPDGAGVDLPSVVETDRENIVIETIKWAEDDARSIIIRFYEAYNRQTSVTLSFSRVVQRVLRTDLMEEEQIVSEVLCDHPTTKVLISVRPYELCTLKIVL